MKTSLFLLITILSLTTAAFASPSKIEIYEQFDKLKMAALISKDAIKKSPQWNPAAEAPPLSVGQAIEAVKTFIRGTIENVNVKEIELRPIPEFKQHWHYLIKIENLQKYSKVDVYIVLMSGKVIPAIIEPQSYK